MGGYHNTSTPSAYSSHYDDNNNQNIVNVKVIIDLRDYTTSNWETTTFRLGVRIKASGTSYIYWNQTGQFIFKVTELDEESNNDGKPGVRLYNI